MKGRPVRIHQKDDAVPFALHTLRPIPFTFQSQVTEELDSSVQRGVILMNNNVMRIPVD